MVEELEKYGDVLDRAIIFAVRAHSGSFRKGTKTPYIVHPMEAAAIVASMTDDKEVIAAGPSFMIQWRILRRLSRI